MGSLGLDPNFERSIIAAEFQIDQGQVSQESISNLIAIYTAAAYHFESEADPQTAELYR